MGRVIMNGAVMSDDHQLQFGWGIPSCLNILSREFSHKAALQLLLAYAIVDILSHIYEL